MGDYKGAIDSRGWSPTPLKYTLGVSKDYSADDSYDSMTSKWFMANWWTLGEWAKKFKNIYPMRVKITSMTFKACTGHSGGKTFAASPSGNLYEVVGAGCTFYATVYREGTNKPFAVSDDHTLQPIDRFNCSTADGGAGATSHEKGKTSFGKVEFFGPGTGRDKDSQDRPRYPVPCIFTNFKDPTTGKPIDLTVEPNQGIFVVIRAKDWTASIDSGLLVLDSSSSNWTADVQPEETDYIWVFNGTKWVKERSVYQFMGNKNWKKLE